MPLPQTHRCVYCHQESIGRFRSPREVPTASGRGWSRGSQSVTWICPNCDVKQGTALKSEPEVCPDCKGNGVTWQHVEGGYLEKVTCGECSGRGHYEETTV